MGRAGIVFVSEQAHSFIKQPQAVMQLLKNMTPGYLIPQGQMSLRMSFYDADEWFSARKKPRVIKKYRNLKGHNLAYHHLRFSLTKKK